MGTYKRLEDLEVYQKLCRLHMSSMCRRPKGAGPQPCVKRPMLAYCPTPVILNPEP